MRACDVAVNLRHPTGGETSASFIRLLAFGRPTIVNQIGAFAEVPEGACLHLPLDGFEESTLVAFLLALAERPALAAAIGEQARAYAVAQHGVGSAAASLSKRSSNRRPRALRRRSSPCHRWRPTRSPTPGRRCSP